MSRPRDLGGRLLSRLDERDGAALPYELATQVEPIDAQDFAHVVATQWKSDEAPSKHLTAWLAMFRIAIAYLGCYVTDTDESLPDDLALWRGVARSRYARGMSWTLDQEKAVWFARRFATDQDSPRLYRVQVEPHDVLGYFAGRQESEIVIDPRLLPRLRGQAL